jgi:hypothetical protein
MTCRVSEFRTVSINGRIYHGGEMVVLTPELAKAIELTGAIEPTADIEKPAEKPQRAKK